MPLYDFQEVYSNFCSKNGYLEIQNLTVDGKQTLLDLGLSIEAFEGRLEPAYVNLKLKSVKEKAETGINENIEKDSLITQFLKRECMYS